MLNDKSILNPVELDKARIRYRQFLNSTRKGEFDFALTPRAECTSYARCFAIFGYGLLRDDLDRYACGLAQKMVQDLDSFKIIRGEVCRNLINDKPYMQLLTFTLSALSILGRLESNPLFNHIKDLMELKIDVELKKLGVFDGVPRSGNQALFLAIVLLYADIHGFNTGESVETWKNLHLNSINDFGFWGNKKSMSHLMFQNGYHQYEIFEYLETPGVPWSLAADNVAKLSDSQGHFAPYPGGG